MQEKHILPVHLPNDLMEWLRTEAIRDDRSLSKQVVHFVRQQKEIREHNFKAMQNQGKNEIGE